MLRPRLAACLIALSALAGAAFAAEPPPPTRSLQGGGGEQQAFVDNANMKAFYDLSVATLRGRPSAAEIDAYEAKSYVLFRALGVSLGASPDAMQDHLKAIPRQMVQIARDDPTVLDSYKNFILALMGPP